MVIAVDFDGTIVENKYPEIGAERPFAIETLKMLIADRHRLVLWSCREGELLDEALQWCRDDDRNVGGLPDWGTIYRMVSRGKKWRHLIDEAYAGQTDYDYTSNYRHSTTRTKKSWWPF